MHSYDENSKGKRKGEGGAIPLEDLKGSLLLAHELEEDRLGVGSIYLLHGDRSDRAIDADRPR